MIVIAMLSNVTLAHAWISNRRDPFPVESGDTRTVLALFEYQL